MLGSKRNKSKERWQHFGRHPKKNFFFSTNSTLGDLPKSNNRVQSFDGPIKREARIFIQACLIGSHCQIPLFMDRGLSVRFWIDSKFKFSKPSIRFPKKRIFCQGAAQVVSKIFKVILLVCQLISKAVFGCCCELRVFVSTPAEQPSWGDKNWSIDSLSPEIWAWDFRVRARTSASQPRNAHPALAADQEELSSTCPLLDE